MSEMETPEADAAEQERTVVENERQLDADDVPIEVDDGDLAESMVEVPLDDEDYR